MKTSLFALLFCVLTISGCERRSDLTGPIRNHPLVTARFFTNKAGRVTMEVLYEFHDQRGWCYARMTDKTEVQRYRRQLQNVLRVMDEAELEMID